MTDVEGMLHNGQRFIREFFPVLSTSSLQVYDSALLFSPKETSLHDVYKHELMLPLKIHNLSERTWNLCIRTMEGHASKFGRILAGWCTHCIWIFRQQYSTMGYS
jgi:hypothetical protein